MSGATKAVAAKADDIVLTDGVTGIAANILRKSFEITGFPAPKPSLQPSSRSSRRRTQYGLRATSRVPGIGVGDATVIASEIDERLAADYKAACRRLSVMS